MREGLVIEPGTNTDAPSRSGRDRRRRAIVAAIVAVLVAPMAVLFGVAKPLIAYAGTGGVTEFPIPSSSYAFPAQMAVGSDGNLWFAEFAGSNIGQITPSGTINEFADPANKGGLGTNGIAAGPDGNLWFTTMAGDTVGKITTGGAVTEYAPLQTSNAQPYIMVAGPDGNMWFTEQSADFVGKVTTGGSITEYPISAGAESQFITVGPDGNLWFTEYALNKVGRMTTGGSLTEFALPSGSGPEGIAAGPDGNLWVTEYQTGNVDKLSTSGSLLAQYPTGIGGLNSVNVGPDGNLWLGSQSSSAIGEVSTTGSTVLYPLSGTTPYDVITGPDGNIWYTGRNHQIGRFNTHGACVVNAPTPTPVHPGGAESIAIAVTDCSATALPNATTTTTTTVPSGCPPAPAIPTYVDSLSSGQSSAHTAAITAPMCSGDYTIVSTTTVGSSVVGTATDTYHVAGVGDGFKFTTQSLPGYIAAGSDGNLWVTFGSTLAQVTTSGIVTTFSSAVQGYAQQLVTGSDGDLYVNTSATGQSDIANLQPASYGPAFKWEVPVTGTSINDLAPGPDGNVWFAGHPSVSLGGTLGFVTPAGKVKLFHLPLADGAPQAITPGSDGALWFLLDSGQIGRISTTGAVTLFTPPTPTNFGGSNNATLGADGNVWFAGSDSNGNDIVGRISPVGDVREYATLQPRAEITGITAGADGNVWFNQPELRSCGFGSGVGRVTPSGVLADFGASCIDSNDRWNIVAGPDGNLWNSAYYGSGVVQILTVASSSCTALSTSTNPTNVTQGSPEMLSTAIENCASTPQLMKLETKTVPPSGCGVATTVHTNVPLQPRVGTTVSSTFNAPNCAGTYKVVSTLSTGKNVVAKTTTTYNVT